MIISLALFCAMILGLGVLVVAAMRASARAAESSAAADRAMAEYVARVLREKKGGTK